MNINFKNLLKPPPSLPYLKKALKTLQIHHKKYLIPLKTEEIILSLNKVVQLWLKPASPIRKEAVKLLSLTTVCSKKIISEGLDLAFQEVTRKNLENSLRQLKEFPRPKVSTFIFAGIIPTPMLFDIFLALLLKSSVFIKCPSRAPLFPILVVRSIQKMNPDLGECIAAFHWPGGKSDLETALFEKSDLIHAYGNDETIGEISKKIPSSKTFLSFGHKLSFSIILKEHMTKRFVDSLTQKVAYDVSLYDQQGCMSPHVIYIQREGDISACDWAKKLADAMQGILKKLPAGEISLSEASQIHQIRGQAAISSDKFCISSHPITNWTVIYEKDPSFHASCLNRVIFVKPFSNLNQLHKSLKKEKGHFQALGFSATDRRKNLIRDFARKLEIPMLQPLGGMQKLSFEQHIEERWRKLKHAGRRN